MSPFHDGSKCFVRDLTNYVENFETAVLGSPFLSPELLRARIVPLHKSAGTFSPALRENLRTLAWLVLRSRADIWHFAFAPNPRSSAAARLARSLRRVPTLQTVVSPPRSFTDPERLLFGDIVVTQSRWTRDQFRGAFGFRGVAAPRIEVIHPVAPVVLPPGDEDLRRLHDELRITPDVPLIVYPGDLEMSRGSSRVAELIEPLTSGSAALAPVVVFAYRNKTPGAAARREVLASTLDPKKVRFIADTPLIHALLFRAQIVVFPVDDLFGKVDLPIVLLEALRLGTRVVVSDEGPLRELEPALRLAWDARLWSERILALLKSGSEPQAPVALGAHEPQIAAAAYERLYEALLASQT